jgi:hypothetical protein
MNEIHERTIFKLLDGVSEHSFPLGIQLPEILPEIPFGIGNSQEIQTSCEITVKLLCRSFSLFHFLDCQSSSENQIEKNPHADDQNYGNQKKSVSETMQAFHHFILGSGDNNGPEGVSKTDRHEHGVFDCLTDDVFPETIEGVGGDSLLATDHPFSHGKDIGEFPAIIKNRRPICSDKDYDGSPITLN